MTSALPYSRAQWLGLAASSEPQVFEELLGAYVGKLHQTVKKATALRGPEVCILQLPAKANGVGEAFVFNELTVTRCSLRLPAGWLGHSMVMGRQIHHARYVAFFDALMTQPNWAESSGLCILNVLSQRFASKQTQRRVEAEETRVQFFTLAREASSDVDESPSPGRGS